MLGTRTRHLTIHPAVCFAGLFMLLLGVPSRAQEQQFGVFFGGSLAQSRAIQGAPGETVQISAAFAAGLHYDHALWHSRFFKPSIEAEFTVVPPRIVKSLAAAVPETIRRCISRRGCAWSCFPTRDCVRGLSQAADTIFFSRARYSQMGRSTAFTSRMARRLIMGQDWTLAFGGREVRHGRLT